MSTLEITEGDIYFDLVSYMFSQLFICCYSKSYLLVLVRHNSSQSSQGASRDTPGSRVGSFIIAQYLIFDHYTLLNATRLLHPDPRHRVLQCTAHSVPTWSVYLVIARPGSNLLHLQSAPHVCIMV